MMKVVRALQIKDAAGVFSRKLDQDTLEVWVILGGGGGGDAVGVCGGCGVAVVVGVVVVIGLDLDGKCW